MTATVFSQIAVIVPVFNRPTLAVKTLNTVMAQKRAPATLFIVDDGSTDATLEVLAQWVKAQAAPQHSDVSIRLERVDHGGVGRARNHALSQVDAVFVTFLDSDDLWPADFLERVATEMSNDPSAVAVSTDQVFVPADGNLGLRDLSAVSTSWLLMHGAGIGSSTLFRTEAVRQAGGYDESIVSGADFKLFLEISLLGSWRHARGAPVEMLRGHQRHGSEAANLSLSRPENWASWAQIASRFVARHPDRTGYSDAELMQLISRRWQDAARNLTLGECFREACGAYEIALHPRDYLMTLR